MFILQYALVFVYYILTYMDGYAVWLRIPTQTRCYFHCHHSNDNKPSSSLTSNALCSRISVYLYSNSPQTRLFVPIFTYEWGKYIEYRKSVPIEHHLFISKRRIRRYPKEKKEKYHLSLDQICMYTHNEEKKRKWHVPGISRCYFVYDDSIEFLNATDLYAPPKYNCKR